MGSVPKFGSFRPKARSNHGRVTSEKLVHETEHDGGVDSFHRQGSKPDHHRLDKHHSERTGAAENPLSTQPNHHSSNPPRSRHGGSDDSILKKNIYEVPEKSDLFILDRRGDAQNVQFGSLHQYSIPLYRRIGHGRLVGTPDSIKLNHKESTEKRAVLVSAGDDVHAHASRPLITSLLNRNGTSLHLRSEDIRVNELESQADFVPFRSELGQKRDSQPPETAESVENEYRSIDGQTPPVAYRENNSLEALSGRSLYQTSDDVDLLRMKEQALLSQYTKDHPLDVDGWLKLIRHQTKVSSQQAGTLSSKEKSAAADIALSIYDQALAHVDVAKPGYERLVLSMLNEGSMFWDAAKLNRKWMWALKTSPNSTLLWTKYIDFIQTDSKGFRFEACKTAYLQCLRVLQAARKTIKGESEGTSSIQIYIFLRFTSFMRDAGYDELAIGCWQALLEYHFFQPAHPSTLASRLDSLEHFWDAEVPRIGEMGALGWQQFAQNNGLQLDRHCRSETLTSLKNEQLFRRFACEEIKQLQKLHLPATSDNGSMSEDPFRFVMFSDIRSIVETLPDELPVRPLINAFLTFMHLPPVAWDTSGSELRDDTADQYLRHLSGSDRLGMRFAHARQTTYNLFDQAFNLFHTSPSENTGEANGFAANVLKMLVPMLPDGHELSEYILAFGLIHSPSEALKAARRSLKAHPSSLRLYNAYALMEARLGRQQKAEEIWQTALQMRHEFSETIKDESILLWHSRVMTHVLKGDESAALRCIFAMVDDEERPHTRNPQDENQSPAQKLRAIRHLEEGWKHLKRRNKHGLAVLFAECHMWCEYYTSDCKLESVIDLVQQRYLSRIAGNGASFTTELLRQAESLLIKLHFQRHRAYKPAVVSEHLDHRSFETIANGYFRYEQLFWTVLETSRATAYYSRCTVSLNFTFAWKTAFDLPSQIALSKVLRQM